MGRKRLPPDDLREWISRAKSNLAMSRNADPDVIADANVQKRV